MNKPSHEYCKECKDWNGNIGNCMGICGIPIDIIKEWEKYHAIGTPEECRAAVEKQTAKTPTYEGDGYAPDGTFVWDEWLCPHCGSRFEVDYDDYGYCPNCGQKIDWRERE